MIVELYGANVYSITVVLLSLKLCFIIELTIFSSLHEILNFLITYLLRISTLIIPCRAFYRNLKALSTRLSKDQHSYITKIYLTLLERIWTFFILTIIILGSMESGLQ